MHCRNLFFTAAFLFGAQGMAQNFDGLNYQAVIRDGLGNPIPSQNVSLRFEIYPGLSSGYIETHATTTNPQGQVNLVIGTGTVDGGSAYPSFSAIPWSNGDLWSYQASVDITGGNSYSPFGGGPFRSVPFAMHARTSDSWEHTGNDLSNTNTGDVGIGTSTPGAKLDVLGTMGETALRVALPDPAFGSIQLMDDVQDGEMTWDGGTDGEAGFLHYGSATGGTTFGSSAAGGILAIRNNGNVGIGQPTPGQKLDVNGNMNLSGDIYMGGTLAIEDDGSGRTQFYHVGNGEEHLEFNQYNTYLSNTNVYVEENLGLGRDPAVEGIDARLHVEGNVKIEDGTQGAGKVLTSDANGLASWQPVTATSTHSIVLTPTMFNSSFLYGGVTLGTSPTGMPCLNFPDAVTSDAVITAVVPDNFNFSNHVIKVHYSGNVAGGTFHCSLASRGYGIGQAMASGVGGGGLVIPGPTGVETLSVGQTNLVGQGDANSRVLHFQLRRRGAMVEDTSTGIMRVFGITIEYVN